MLRKQTKIDIDSTISKNARIAIVRTDYRKELNDNLEEYCRNTLLEHGVDEKNIATFSVPGSWEIPLITKKLAESGKYDAIVTFGIIVKGETYHFEMIADNVGRALMDISQKYIIPIALEILAVYTLSQAKERTGKNSFNKGIEGAQAVLKSLAVLKTLSR